MNLKAYLLFLVVATSILCSCTDLENQSEFDISKEAWSDFKASEGNSYKYTATFSSWAGFGWETTITVDQGSVSQRDFQMTFFDGEVPDHLTEDELQWTETGADIGTRNDGAEAITLDEVYDKAESVWLIDRSNATTYFESENQGMISLCGYVEDGCQDDCFVGIRISDVTGL